MLDRDSKKLAILQIFEEDSDDARQTTVRGHVRMQLYKHETYEGFYVYMYLYNTKRATYM